VPEVLYDKGYEYKHENFVGQQWCQMILKHISTGELYE